MALNENPQPVLEINNLTKYFGGLCAVKDFSLVVNPGDLAGLIGPNGAGKTTVFNMISGLYYPSGGDIIFQGESLAGLEPFEVTRKGIGRTFQNIRLFPNLNVLDNAGEHPERAGQEPAVR
jgi:branched-chain amino acid transport system ATP-binding protein